MPRQDTANHTLILKTLAGMPCEEACNGCKSTTGQVPVSTHLSRGSRALPRRFEACFDALLHQLCTRFGRPERDQLQLELFRQRVANQALQPAVHGVGGRRQQVRDLAGQLFASALNTEALHAPVFSSAEALARFRLYQFV